MGSYFTGYNSIHTRNTIFVFTTCIRQKRHGKIHQFQRSYRSRFIYKIQKCLYAQNIHKNFRR